MAVAVSGALVVTLWTCYKLSYYYYFIIMVILYCRSNRNGPTTYTVRIFNWGHGRIAPLPGSASVQWWWFAPMVVCGEAEVRECCKIIRMSALLLSSYSTRPLLALEIIFTGVLVNLPQRVCATG